MPDDSNNTNSKANNDKMSEHHRNLLDKLNNVPYEDDEDTAGLDPADLTNVDYAGYDDANSSSAASDDSAEHTVEHDLTDTEARRTDDPDYDPDVPFRLPDESRSDSDPTYNPRKSENAMPTMPHFREPGAHDPKVTLPGTGGLDPNPDMQGFNQNPDKINLSSQDTLQNIRVVRDAPSQSAQPGRPADNRIPRPDSQNTMANPNLAAYDRPANPPQSRQNAQGRYVPPPPTDRGRQGAPGSQQGAPGSRSRIRRQTGSIFGLRSGCVYMMLGLLLTFCGGGTFLTLGTAALFIPRVDQAVSDQISGIDEYRGFETTFIYDRYGNSLYEAFEEGRRESVLYSEFPRNLINATVAIEDDSFWTNIGVDLGATTVAALQYFGANDDDGRPAGGSTITQQVVRNILFDFEKRSAISVQRKAEEIMLAIALTSRKSKEDILTLYLNEIYYGNLAYGAQAAAQTFFGKDVSQLSLGEAALLAGLPQAPANLDPLSLDPAVQQQVQERWRTVLQEMVEEGYITVAESNDALRQGLNFVAPSTSLEAPHFTVYARNEFERLMQDLGYSPDAIARGGYKVYTTVDQDINNIALGAARTQVQNLQANNVSNAAVVVIKPLTGEILGMVGSIDYDSNSIDGRVNVTTALRQPGSTIKPLTYSAAMERGMTAGDVIWDTRTEIGIPGQQTYVPVNYDRQYHGPMALRHALANSYNVPAVQTLRLVGVDYLLQFLQRTGITTLGTDASRYGLSLTLGGGEVSLLELTNAYGVLANLGSYVEVTSILCVVDADNTIIYQYENGCPQNAGRFTGSTIDRPGFGRQALDPRIAFTMTDILSDNQARSTEMGLRSPLYTPNIETAVKTGTTNDVKDNWTVGYTRNVVVGVWVGNNNGDPMVNSSGLSGAAPIWNSVISSIYASKRDVLRVGGQLLADKPSAPGGMSLRQICDVRRLNDPAPTCPAQRAEWFLDGPAGVPDASGNLVYPPQRDLTGQTPSGVAQEISPDIYRMLVFSLPPNVASGITFPSLQPGDKTPPPPRYCRVQPQQTGIAAGAQELLFVASPSTSHNDAVEAERYAQQNNIPFAPTIECWDDAFSTAGNNFGAPVATAIINSPANGETLSGPTPVIGTVQFDSGQADFYHLYIQGGQFPNWTPLGEEHYQSVTNGVLEEIYVPALEPGTYRLRLALVRGGDFIQQPFEITFYVQ